MGPLDRRAFLRSGTAMAAAAYAAGRSRAAKAAGSEIVLDPNVPLFPAPDDPKLWDAYRQSLYKWREQTRQRLGYDDALYRRDGFAWVPSAFSCCFVMMCDQTFFDPGEGRYLVESLLEQGQQFGGFDAVVLWHAYPRIGFDDRNQFDFYRDMPGGLAGLKELVAELHRRGVKVFIDYNPWDTGTRREGVSDLDALAALLEASGADGIFLDTMRRAAAEFRRRLDQLRPGLVLESELALPVESIADHHLSWAQGFNDSRVPGVLRNKWFERRHMQHQIKRWNTDHTSELHSAWMNGSGMLVWENVFGNLLGWNARDRSILRSMLPIQRRYVDLFSGEGWTPLVPAEKPDVYVSLWEDGKGVRLWTLVNRADVAVDGTLLRVWPGQSGCRYFDLVRGRELSGVVRDGRIGLEGMIRPRGIGAFLAASDAVLDYNFPAFLASQQKLDARADFSTAFPRRRTTLRVPEPTPRCPANAIPQGMVAIPAAELRMKVTFRTRECGFYHSHDEVTQGFHKPQVLERDVRLAPYAIDLAPVTNAQYEAFLRASGYRPRHAENFLKHWQQGCPPRGVEDHPVVYVDLDDARAYARWAGKRLPTEEEWQYAAQGPEGLEYPWGNVMKPGCCNSGEHGGTTSVTAFPQGRSPFGCYDMCGNTWEWTESERSDGRTRFAVLKGGSYYQARGSDWYADGGPRPASFAAKFLLTWPGLDRCATIGFRCAVDVA